ncbi:MAG: hypothetical protein EA364_03745 [Balneolaceae bacterium]|nr:MAG: hypothetical protein EA364_03745 [Balneolaceae bacterium]
MYRVCNVVDIKLTCLAANINRHECELRLIKRRVNRKSVGLPPAFANIRAALNATPPRIHGFGLQYSCNNKPHRRNKVNLFFATSIRFAGSASPWVILHVVFLTLFPGSSIKRITMIHQYQKTA